MSMARARRRGFHARPMDMTTAGEGFARPGMDTRQWVSYGRVSADEGTEVVSFDEEAGQVFVQVVLEPTRVTVTCRVSSNVAGNGEGEYHPFVSGDEVLVLIPEGSERAGCVIVGRLNNAIDKFPMDSVAGQDPTTNSFAFSRRRTPFVTEYAGPIMLRSALNEALISIDTAGTVTIRDMNGSALQISPDAVTLQGQSAKGEAPKYLMQLNMTGGQLTLQADDAILNLSTGSASVQNSNLTAPGSFTLQTSGNAALEHATTTEQVAGVLVQTWLAFSVFVNTLGGAPLTGTGLATAIAGWLATPAFAAAWTAAAAAPLGAVASTLPAVLSAALAAQPPKVSNPLGQANPGIGCQGLFLG